jgi:hypothetical protein
MANTTHAFGIFLTERHANFFCIFKRDDLADIVKQRRKNQFLTSSYMLCQ